MLFLPLGLVEFAEPEGRSDAAAVGSSGGVLFVFIIPADGDDGVIKVLAEEFDDFVEDFLLCGVHVFGEKTEIGECEVELWGLYADGTGTAG